MLQNLQNFANFQKFQLHNLVNFEKCCTTRIYLQRSVPIQPKTSEHLPNIFQKLPAALAARRPRGVPREARDGVGPPMKDCRRRHFRQLPEVPPEVATEVEGDMIEILARGAADPETYEDIEEEWVEGPEGQPGYWQRVFRADV